MQELLLKLVEDNYPLASDPDATPGKTLYMYTANRCLCGTVPWQGEDSILLYLEPFGALTPACA